MKKLLLPLGVAVACMLPAAAFAHTDLSIGVGLGFPGYYEPAPVYYAPPPRVVYYDEPVYYPAPAYYYGPAYGPRVYYHGYYGPRYHHGHGYGHYRRW